MTNYREKLQKTLKNKKRLSDYIDHPEQNAVVSRKTVEDIAKEAESERFVRAFIDFKRNNFPNFDYLDPKTFCFYGSAERYYEDSIRHICRSYPYDGSRAEKKEWALSSSYLDLYMLEHQHPKTKGSVNFSHSGWGTRSGSKVSGYGKPSSAEYIYFNGVPTKTTKINNSYGWGNNLKIDGTAGNTVEFFLKKDAFVADTLTEKEVILDISTYDPDITDATKKGRLTIEIQSSSAGASPLLVTYKSGSEGLPATRIGKNITNSLITDGKWHHYAISFRNESGSIKSRLYVDGVLDDTITSGTAISSVDTIMVASLGSLIVSPDPSDPLDYKSQGWGKLSGSLDEFRFWKSERDIKEIGTHWYRPIHGGTSKNSDYSNSELSIYYKFNNHITSDPTRDKIIIDYSGRINNGVFYGYHAAARSQISAIDESLFKPDEEKDYKEPKDPCVDETAGAVESLVKEFKFKGRAYDLENNQSLSRNVPSYFIESDENGLFGKMLQILASMADRLTLDIKLLSSLKNIQYQDFFGSLGSQDASSGFLVGCEGCEDDYNRSIAGSYTRDWSDSILYNFGLMNIKNSLPFSKALTSEFFLAMNPSGATYEREIQELKNKWLNNIHTCLSLLHDTKGTDDAFRNFFRACGFDTELVKFNKYSKNEEYALKDSPVSKELKIKSANFSNSNRSATIFQTSTSSPEEINYIKGQSSYTPYTFEINTLFPKATEDVYDLQTASIFGIHSVDPVDGYLPWSSPDSASLQVKSIKYSTSRDIAKFLLTSSAGIISELETQYFDNVYDGNPWNLSVRIRKEVDTPKKIGPGIPEEYSVVFSGYRSISDVITEQFNLTSSVSKAVYDSFNSSNKSVFLGSEHQNFSGSVIENSDVRVMNFSCWSDDLKDTELQSHCHNPSSYGRDARNNVVVGESSPNLSIFDSLLFRWQFENLTSSNSSGELQVADFSSGSLRGISDRGLSGYKYPAAGAYFLSPEESIAQEFISAISYSPIDNLYDSDQVQTKDREVDLFEANIKPNTLFFSFEKSMYQVISDEILGIFAGLSSYNNLIGEPINKYRPDYKSLEKLRHRFFDKVENEIDLEKFVEFYKWIDSWLTKVLEQFQPATSVFSDKLRDMVESHILERNKYEHRFPTLEMKANDPIGVLLGINELLYDWEHGHAPITPPVFTPATAELSTTGNPGDLQNFVLVDAHTVAVHYVFRTDLADVSGQVDDLGRSIIGVSGSVGSAAAVGDRIRAAIDASPLHVEVEEISAGEMRLTQLRAGEIGNTFIDLSAVDTVTSTNFTGGTGKLEDMNCLWWRDRAERDKILSVLPDTDPTRESLRVARNSIVSGSTYVLRKLTRAYKFSAQRQKLLYQGSNPGSNKFNDFYRIVNSGRDVVLDREDIYDFRRCNDIITPEKKKFYIGKTITTGANDYFNADANMIFPFSMVSSSGGTDFSVFKEDLRITNNLDNLNTPDSAVAIQGTFPRRTAGGMPHRMVPLFEREGNRNEAYILEATSGSLIMKAAVGKPRSMFYKAGIGRPVQSTINIKSGLGDNPLFNYTHDHEILMTGGRSINNRTLTEDHTVHNRAIPSAVSGFIDYERISRTRNEFVIANRFSAPGGVETINSFMTDRESDEYSVYNSINYRNLNVRGVQNTLSSEHSEQFSIRSGSTVAASWHGVNRNVTKTTGSSGHERRYDNYFVTRPIPQTDYQYSWIGSSVSDTVYDFLNKNENFGYVHDFTPSTVSGSYSSSRSQIGFLLSSSTEDVSNSNITFSNLSKFNSVSIDNVFTETNTLSTKRSHSLNAMLLDRSGPYGWPSWKQLRGASHPVARGLRSQNLYSITVRNETPNVSSMTNYDSKINPHHPGVASPRSVLSSRKHKNYKEILVSNKFRPINITFHAGSETEIGSVRLSSENVINHAAIDQRSEDLIWHHDNSLYDHLAIDFSKIDNEVISKMKPDISKINESFFDRDIAIKALNINSLASLRLSYQNDISTFANQDITSLLNLREDKNHYFKNFLIGLSEKNEINPSSGFEMSYEEVVYPREINTFTLSARSRENFKFFGWNSNRQLRNIILTGSNVYGDYAVSTATYAAFPEITNSGIYQDKNTTSTMIDSIDLKDIHGSLGRHHITCSSWVLDSRQNFAGYPVDISKSFFNFPTTFLTTRDQASRGEGLLQNDYSIFGLGYNGIYGTPPAAPVYNRRIPQTVESGTNFFYNFSSDTVTTSAGGTKSNKTWTFREPSATTFAASSYGFGHGGFLSDAASVSIQDTAGKTVSAFGRTGGKVYFKKESRAMAAIKVNHPSVAAGAKHRSSGDSEHAGFATLSGSPAITYRSPLKSSDDIKIVFYDSTVLGKIKNSPIVSESDSTYTVDYVFYVDVGWYSSNNMTYYEMFQDLSGALRRKTKSFQLVTFTDKITTIFVIIQQTLGQLPSTNPSGQDYVQQTGMSLTSTGLPLVAHTFTSLMSKGYENNSVASINSIISAGNSFGAGLGEIGGQTVFENKGTSVFVDLVDNAEDWSSFRTSEEVAEDVKSAINNSDAAISASRSNSTVTVEQDIPGTSGDGSIVSSTATGAIAAFAGNIVQEGTVALAGGANQSSVSNIPSGWSVSSQDTLSGPRLLSSGSYKVFAFTGSYLASSSAGLGVYGMPDTNTSVRYIQLDNEFGKSITVKFDHIEGSSTTSSMGYHYGLHSAPYVQDNFYLQYSPDSGTTWYTALSFGTSSVGGTQFTSRSVNIYNEHSDTTKLRWLETTSNSLGTSRAITNISISATMGTYLAGEAEWTAAQELFSFPFYDSYEDFREEIRLVGQDHSILGEFRISDHIEDIYRNHSGDFSKISDDFLSITGAIYQTSSGDLVSGTNFFKTYSTTDFLKYFNIVGDCIEENDLRLDPTRLTLKCQAAMKFLPYEGFYPAERTVQLTELFTRGYLSSGSYKTREISQVSNSETLLGKKLNASLQQSMKPLFSPGVLYNSIKTGLAVDYPIFETPFGSSALSSLESAKVPLTSHASMGHSQTGITGSLINNTVDGGIPRIKSNTTTRVSFEDLLSPELLYEEEIYDNEPHPSGTICYGGRHHAQIFDYPFKFGTLDSDRTAAKLGRTFERTQSGFSRELIPYKLAINNFTSETVNFFIEGSELQTFVSQPVYDNFEADKTYRMRVYLENDDVVMYDRHSAFGPPVDDGTVNTKEVTTSSIITSGSNGSISLALSTWFYEPPITSVLADLPGFKLTDSSGTTGTVKYYHESFFTSSAIQATDTFTFITPPSSIYGTSTTQLPGFTLEDVAGVTYTIKYYRAAYYGSSITDTSDTGFIDADIYDTATKIANETKEKINNFTSLGITVTNGSGTNVKILTQDTAGAAGNGNITSITGSTYNTGESFINETDLAFTGGGTGGVSHPTSNGTTQYINIAEQSGVDNPSFSDAVSWFNSLGQGSVQYSSSFSRRLGNKLAEVTSTAINNLSLSMTATHDEIVAYTPTGIVTITENNTGSHGSIEETSRIYRTFRETNPTGVNYDLFNDRGIFSLLTFSQAGKVVYKDAGTSFASFEGGSFETTRTERSLSTVSRTSLHGFRPYVPPFLDPGASPYIELSYRAPTSGFKNLPEILDNLTASYVNFKEDPSNPSTNSNYKHAMSLSASVNFKDWILVDEYDTQEDAKNKYRWVIQTKWESPILDFKDSAASALRLDTGVVESVKSSPWKPRGWDNYYGIFNTSSAPYLTSSTGMWHQAGVIPKSSGYNLVLADSPGTDSRHQLARKLGFLGPEKMNPNVKTSKYASSKKKIGTVATRKEISEAVVAVPYYCDDNGKVLFFDIDRKEFAKAEQYNETLAKYLEDSLSKMENNFSDTVLREKEKEIKQAFEKKISSASGFQDRTRVIAYQLRMMEKFIFPPKFDFKTFQELNPFFMYVFKFNATLDQADLAKIWQNLYPSTAESTGSPRYSDPMVNLDLGIEMDTKYVSHFLTFDDIPYYHGNRDAFLKDRVRWLVFKVKQRAETDYARIRLDSITNKGVKRSSISKNSIHEILRNKKFKLKKMSTSRHYGFNWPYDYFSFVELIKLEGKVDFFPGTSE